MKVLHVEMGRHLYGGARQVTYLLDGLAAFPGEHVLACAEGAAIATAFSRRAAAVRPLRFAGDADVGFIARLRNLIRTERPSLLHIHSRRGDALSALAGRAERVPMVHSRRVDNPPRWVDLKLKVPSFGRIVTISRGIRDVLIDADVPASQVVCVPSAVDTGHYRPQGDRAWFRETFRLPVDAPVWAVIAQLIPRKGHAVLFEALPTVLQRHPKLQVLVFGKGPLDAELRRLSEQRGLSENVRFEGFRKDLERIIPCLDGVIHPAWMEGLGVCLLETAACGVPIIACRAGGIPEIVRHGVNGFLLEPGDSAALAAALTKLLGDPQMRREFGHAGRELVLDEFAIPRMVEGNYRVYQDVLGATGTRPTGRERSL
ncbi:MAG: GDP-mannose-dependent alpha-(1-6)-phosphatidylinositol monomannoside mannosyltransferase [Proteobacteria bacterium]|nr:GDP-mannose-dependent alpha-(1-6)-phosphatidylinositol monomannoside mannosyltransferase [Pseudomonadota bacterium]